MRVLEGIRVLDFGRYIAGPYCAALMAEHGAEVIRIEKREGSEDRFQAPVAATGEGALFLQMNRNKRGMTLDPMRPEGQEIVRKLVKTADVVVANLPPQTLAAMRLDYETLRSIKPDIILTTATAYGRGGPYSDRVGFDGVGQVMSGAVYMTGEAHQPYRAQVPWVDFSTALHCAFGTMVALMARRATGKGQVVEGALLATAVTLSNALLIEQAVIKRDRVPTGNRGQTAAPVDLFRTRDGWVLCQVIGQPLFRRWVDRKSTRLNSSHVRISYAVFCLKKKNQAGALEHPSADVPGLPGRFPRPHHAARLGLSGDDRGTYPGRGLLRRPSCFFFLIIRQPPRPTLFPSTTLFR